MNACQNLIMLSGVACRLFECLGEEEFEALAADLSTLGDMMESILAHQALCPCGDKEQKAESVISS